MKFEDCKKGMPVRISIDISKSLDRFGGQDEKRRLAGSIQTIERIRDRYHAILVTGGWNFDAADLHPVDIDIKEENLKFDNISELQKGMKIKIACNVEDSIRKHGGKDKRKFAGTLQTISKVRPDCIRIYDGKQSWHFTFNDIRKAPPILPSREPEFFDPNDLVI